MKLSRIFVVLLVVLMAASLALPARAEIKTDFVKNFLQRYHPARVTFSNQITGVAPQQLSDLTRSGQLPLTMGDLIIALSATAADSTASHYVLGEPHAPTADFTLVHEAVHQAKHLGKPVRVGPIVSSDIFYNPDPGQAARWSDRGILGVEMEAAVLFTLGALRKIQTGCMLLVSDVIVEGEFLRISDEDMRKAVDEMTELALHTVTS